MSSATFATLATTARIADEVADADARRDQLGERAHVQDTLRRERPERGLLGAAIAQQAVGRVLEHVDAVLLAQLDDPPALGARAGRTRRVLEVRDRVEELRARAADRGLERTDVGAVRLEGNADHGRAVATQHGDRPVVGRRLGEHDVAGLEQREAEELDDLQRTVGGEDLRRLDALPLAPATRAAARTRSRVRTAARRRPAPSAPPRRRRSARRWGRTRSRGRRG